MKQAPQWTAGVGSLRRHLLDASVLLLLLVAPAALAATLSFSVGLDTDDNAATGCTLATAGGPVPGIEQVARAMVTTSTAGAVVTRLERQTCAGTSFGAPTVYDNGGWPVGLGNGTGGSAVIESSLPLALLGATGRMRAVVVSGDGSSGEDATSTFALTVTPPAAAPVVPVPLSPWLAIPLSLLLGAAAWWRRHHPDQTALLVLLAFVSVSGLVWAATVMRDGNAGDWAGVTPAATDVQGDAPPNADLVAVHTQQDGTNLFFRIDADVRRDAPANEAPVVNAGTAQSITLPASASLSGSATDDGLPNPPATVTYAWTKVSGPGTVTFGTATDASTTAAFSVAGVYVLRLTANDSALTGTADVTVTVNPAVIPNQAPTANAGTDQTITLPAQAALSGGADDDGLPNPPATVTHAWTKVSGPGTVTFGSATDASTTAAFSVAGIYVLRLTSSDGALSGSDDVTITVDPAAPMNTAPIVDAGAGQTITLPASASLSGGATDDGLPNPPGSLTTVWSQDSGPGTVTFANANAPSTTATFPVAGAYVLRLTANDGALAGFATVAITVNDGIALPPDPATIAPALDPTLATEFGSATAFLYTGADPIQTGVAPGTIDANRAAVIRGRLLDKSNNPLPGATVRIRHHAEFGQTLTRADGRFDLAVNGGGPLTLDYIKPGYLPAQRQVVARWQDYALVDDTILIPEDAKVSTIDLADVTPPFHVAQGSPVTDPDGTRQVTLLIPQGTQARVYNPDGSTRPVTTLNLRFTEYTVGANGPATMPAQLPPSSAYTYAFEAKAEEADSKIAGKDVLFDRPVPFYVDNFLSFPVGTVVPVGYYDEDRGLWVPSDNGKVVKILAITGGVADIDSDGDDLADDAATLAALGITDQERTQLASLYAAGNTLWRVPVTHLSRWDCNWSYVMPSDAVAPLNATPSVGEGMDNPNAVCGSIIECQNQALRESLPLAGSGLTLNYASSWVGGNKSKATAVIPVSGTQLPASLKRIDVQIDVAGRHFEQQLPAQPNQRLTFTWDGMDVYGRPVAGAAPTRIRIGYVYTAVYARSDEMAAAFARFSGIPLSGNQARGEVSIWQQHTISLTAVSPKAQGLAGWSLDVHHSYDPAGRTLYFGTGRHRSARKTADPVIATVAGNGQGYIAGYGDGGPAVDARLLDPGGVVSGADGSLYIADTGNGLIRRVTPNGIITTVAGNGTSGAFSGDGGPATAARLNSPGDVALGPDGSLYIADTYHLRIRRVGPDGTINTFAGNGLQGDEGDGGPATAARLNYPRAIAVGADGAVYIADEQNNRIRRVGTDGIITTVAGIGTVGSTGDGGPATQASLTYPSDVAVGLDGSLYIADTYNHLVRRVAPDGIITTVAGKRGLSGQSGDGWLATEAGLWYPTGVDVLPDGSLFISDSFYPRIRYVGADGVINTIAGDGSGGFSGDGGPATVAQLFRPLRLGVDAAGALYIPDSSNNRVRRVVPTLPRFAAGNLVIASDDGTELYRFDAAGRRHIDTIHALTGALRHAFGYDAANRLVSVTDADGNITTIERDSAGIPTAILSPYGQRTTLTVDASGYLATVANPAGEVHRIAYTTGGLLTEFKYPKGGASSMIYDALGRLTRDSDAAGGFKALARTEADRTYTVALSTALGRTTRYQVDDLLTGNQKRLTTASDGTQTELLTDTEGSRKTTLPDGTIVDLAEGPDPRFSMQAPIPKTESTSTGGLTSAFAMSREANLSNPADPLSLVSQTDTVTLNGRLYSSSYLASTRTFTGTTPANRQSTTTLDAQGRPIGAQAAGLEPVAVTYDGRGRIATVVAGSGPGARATSIAYNAEGFLASITDPLGRVESFAYDAAGRVTTQTLPGGRVVQYAYDANGNLTSLTPPGRPAHAFTHTPVDLMASYVPPDVGAGTNQTQYTYNADRQLTQVSRPDGQTVAFAYDAAGRVNATAIARGTISYGYSPTTGQMTSIAAPDGLGLAYTYDGALLNTVTWSGPIAGTVARTYDNDFRVTGLAVNGTSVPFNYDADSLLTGAGAMTLTRSPQNGLLTGTTLGNATDAWTYNGFGEPVNYTASYGGSPIFQQQFTRDALGRIVQKVETIGGVTDTYVYGYDAAGRLAQVTKNAVVAATYTFDLNGNRLSATVAGVPTTGTYDDQDRMTTYGTAAYAYTANGELLTKTDGAQVTTYAYDGLYNLTSVALPNGTSIGYRIDGRNRRVGRTVNGTPTQGFLYQSGLRPVAELDGSNNVVSRFVYGTKVNVPEYVVKGATTYRIVTDHLGSPRLVVDVGTGTVAQRMDYDEFGRVLNDTNPGFQPFGFAGGLYDQDTKLVRFGARDYDAVTGRWTSKDPVGFEGGIANLFDYGAGDPVNNIDPTGTVVVWRLLPNGVRMVRFNPLQPAMTVLAPAAEPVALSLGTVAAVAAAGAAGYAIGTLIDCGITAALGKSLGDWLYDFEHPEDNAPAGARWGPYYRGVYVGMSSHPHGPGDRYRGQPGYRSGPPATDRRSW
jgi:RHS repeat-associated protein